MMMNKLTEKEKQTIVGTFEITYGYAAWELVKVSPLVENIFKKLGIEVESEGRNSENHA